mgnify:CR=1 FL=1
MNASLIWFRRGFVEYKFPNNGKVLGAKIDRRRRTLLAAGDHGGADFRLEFSTCIVVEEEQGLGALHH